MNDTDLLRCLVQVVARAAIPPRQVLTIIGTSKKHLKAFNLCDGSRSLGDIAREAKIDQGNLSRTTTRWLENGILFRFGEGKASRLMHVYPVAPPGKRGKGEQGE